MLHTVRTVSKFSNAASCLTLNIHAETPLCIKFPVKSPANAFLRHDEEDTQEMSPIASSDIYLRDLVYR
jgi:hypothetical protein